MILYTFFVGFIFALIVPFKETVISEEFKPYYNDFVTIVKEHCEEDQYFHPNFVMEFQKLGSSYIGECFLRPDRFVIYIDIDYWNNGSYNKRYSLVFHELTHCMLGLNHVPIPTDYMYPSDMIINDKETVNEQLREYLRKKCGVK